MLHLFFGIVNQVLVRLWARRWWEIRANGCLPSRSWRKPDREIAKSDRPRSYRVATPGVIQPSDRRHMRSEAFDGRIGCDAGVVHVCKLSFERCVRSRGADVSWCGWFLYMMVWIFVAGEIRGWRSCALEHEKGIRWMPWHQEAMKDVARCEKPRGAASRR